MDWGWQVSFPCSEIPCVTSGRKLGGRQRDPIHDPCFALAGIGKSDWRIAIETSSLAIGLCSDRYWSADIGLCVLGEQCLGRLDCSGHGLFNFTLAGAVFIPLAEPRVLCAYG